MRYFFFILISSVLSISTVHAQTNNQNTFVSAVDQDLSLKSVLLLPVTDNVNGIYAKPVEEELRKSVDADLQWSLLKSAPANAANVKTTQLDDNPKQVAQILKAAPADGLLTARLTKGPNGINATLTLYVGKDGLPLLQETLVNYKGFDINDVRAEFKRMFTQLKARLPYKGLIMSRRGQQVTLNLGSSYGLKPDMTVTIVQIIKINRHPKLHFMISTEKEVLGRVQLQKVDEHLSFGSVTFEREPGVITVGAKVLPEEFVKYQAPAVSPDGKILQGLADRKDKDVAFGESPQEWLPEAPPQFGKFSVLAGFANYEQNSTLIGGPSISATNNMAPSIALRGELWLSSEWYVGASLRQSIFSVGNSLSGSTPEKLNMAISQYDVEGGYNFLLSNDFFGPKFQVSAGFGGTKFRIDNSTPTAYSTMDYGGILLGLGGQMPISNETPIDLGFNYRYWFNPTVAESSSSGSASNSVNSFGFFVDYRLRTKFKIKAELDFEYYNSNFSGTPTRANPASSTSHKVNTLLVGIEYLL